MSKKQKLSKSEQNLKDKVLKAYQIAYKQMNMESLFWEVTKAEFFATLAKEGDVLKVNITDKGNIQTVGLPVYLPKENLVCFQVGGMVNRNMKIVVFPVTVELEATKSSMLKPYGDMLKPVGPEAWEI